MITKKYPGKSLFFILSIVCISFTGLQTANAQIGDVGEILQSGADDASLLLNEYLKPFGTGFGAGLNSGWVNTAKPYKPFGIDLRVNVGAAVVPTAEQSFNARDMVFQNLEYISGSPAESQTA